MLTKGLLGGEIDLIWSIRTARGNFEVKYIKEREYLLLLKLINEFTNYFYLKPVFMLSLQPGFSGTLISSLKKAKPYDTFIFDGNYRNAIDRTQFYDALLFFIVELHKYYTIHEESAQELLTTDLFSDSTTPHRIFFERFSHMKLDSTQTVDTIIQKRKWALKRIKAIYPIIVQTHKDNGIANIQAYTKSMTWPILKKHWNHRYTNFSASGKLPNPLLIQMRTSFRAIHNRTLKK